MESRLTRFVALFVVALSLSTPALAMDGVFDRSAEVDKYLETLSTGSQMTMTTALNRIYWSGISDKRLADALNDLLLRDFAEIGSPKSPPAGRPRFQWTVDEKYGVGLIEALASMGMPEYNATFEKIGKQPSQGGASNKRMRKEAAAAHKTVELRTGLAKAMVSRENHIEGGDPTTSMLINLVKSDNRLHRDFALDRIEREKLRDPRLLGLLESQILDYVKRAPVAKPTWQETYTRRNIKVLGVTGDLKYQSTMQAVLASSVDEGTKKHASVAAERLSVPGTPGSP